jgi:polyhydroxyalkanoate synthesis regulator phasin
MAARKTVTPVLTASEAEDVARKIWLAGVGAYGRMFAEAQDRVEKAASSANDLFEQLVARGEALEDQVRARLESNEATKKIGEAIGRMQDYRAEQRAALKARVETFRKGVEAYNPLVLHRQVQELSARVDALEGKTARPARAAAKRVAPKRAKR